MVCEAHQDVPRRRAHSPVCLLPSHIHRQEGAVPAHAQETSKGQGRQEDQCRSSVHPRPQWGQRRQPGNPNNPKCAHIQLPLLPQGIHFSRRLVHAQKNKAFKSCYAVAQFSSGGYQWCEPREEGLHLSNLCQGIQQLHEPVHAQEDEAPQHWPSWIFYISQRGQHGPLDPHREEGKDSPVPAVHETLCRLKRPGRLRGKDARSPQRRDDDAQQPPPSASATSTSHPFTAASWNGFACRTHTGANHTSGKPSTAFPCS